MSGQKYSGKVLLFVDSSKASIEAEYILRSNGVNLQVYNAEKNKRDFDLPYMFSGIQNTGSLEEIRRFAPLIAKLQKK